MGGLSHPLSAENSRFSDVIAHPVPALAPVHNTVMEDPSPLAGPARFLGDLLQILLNESGTEVNVELDEWRIADRLKTVYLARLDNEDVACTTLEGFAVNRPDSPTFADELDFVIGMPVRTWSRSRLSMKQDTETLVLPCSAPTN